MSHHDFEQDCRLNVIDEELRDEWGRVADEGDCVLTCGDDIVAVYPRSWCDRKSIDALCLWFNDDVEHAAKSLEGIRPFDTPLELANLLLAVMSSNDGLETVMRSSPATPEHIANVGGHYSDERQAAIASVQCEVRDYREAKIGHRPPRR